MYKRIFFFCKGFKLCKRKGDFMCKKLIDFYELTMAYTDMKNGKLNERCYFDVFDACKYIRWARF